MIDKTWTLFLDRDGVINKRLFNRYVKKREELEIKPDFMEAIKLLRPLFGRIIIVTNQQGIAKGVTSEAEIKDVHQYLKEILLKEGVTVDGIYYCPHLENSSCGCRKPDTGMALKANEDFPDIDFKKSVMVGDNLSDILFGNRCGMVTVYIGDVLPETAIDSPSMPDYFCKDMMDFARLII